jgi:hypothetical protein
VISVASYAGAGNFPYWMTVSSNGAFGAGTQSENIPVTAGLSYQFQVVCAFEQSWASGVELALYFFTAGGSPISDFTATQANMAGGQLYQVNTGLVTAPAGASYAIAYIILEGTPSASNLLQVYQAELDSQNYSQVNINYAFTWSFWPWSPYSTSVLGWAASPLLAGDSDSLVMDGIIELMGGAQGVQADVPELLDSNGQGPTFRILAPPSLNSAAFGYEPSYDLNAPQPTQDVVASMLLDGERPFGARASNRTMSLPIVIFGTMAGGMNQVLKAREYLMSVIDQQVWQMKWTPADTGLGMIFDCFRALPSTPLYGFNYSAGGSATGQTVGKPNYPIAMITLSIQALPYGRSDIDGVQALALSNPLTNGVPTVSASAIDTFSSVFSPPPVITTPAWYNIGEVNPTGVSTWNTTVSTSVGAGNTLIVQVAAAANTLTGVTDSAGNVYALAGVKQAGSAAQWQYLYTAPVQSVLTGGVSTVTVNSSVSGNFSSTVSYIAGAWAPRAALPVSATGTGTSYSVNLSGLNAYDLLLSVEFGASGNPIPVAFTPVIEQGANGFTTIACTYAMPINASTLTYSISSGLPNPWGIMLFALQPVNQYWNLDTTTPPPTFTGHSVHYIPPRPVKTPYPAATYARTLASAANIVGCPVLSVYFGQSYDAQWPKDPKFVSNVTLHWTLTDNLGRTLSFSQAQKKVLYGTSPSTPKWTRINAAIPQGKTFSYNAVTAYSVRITNWAASGHTGYVRMHCWLNDIIANPQTIQNPLSPRGSLYNLFSLAGTARSPLSVQCQLPAAASKVQEITTPQSGGYWITPPGVYSVFAETWAGGGAGAALDLSRAIAGGGGGGAEYAAEPALPVVPGQKVPFSIGAGGLPAQLASTVIQYTSPGLAHWTCPANVTSVLVECWGGGGAGAAGSGGGGGGGYGSKTQAVTPGATYYLWVGKGGKADTGTTAAQNAARAGGNTYFSNLATSSLATALAGATGGNTSTTGSTLGGNGGSNASAPGTLHHNGGRGGSSPGPAGGGGGGAAGSSGGGGTGGDSLPYAAALGHWTQGGAGGAGGSGTTPGGAGGAGANAPGFPVQGVIPGGGGGGGFTSVSLYTTLNPSNALPGSGNVNFLGADGATGMIQLTYAVGGGSPVNGGNTTFGSVAATGTIVTAHGGTSAASNSAAGGAGGTGSSNTAHSNGGAGGLNTGTALGSYLAPKSASLFFSYLGSMTYNSTSDTSGTAAASVAQGVAIALIESTAQVSDLVVTDSAGNQYQVTGGVQAAGSGGTGAAVYCYVANIEYPVTTATTLTVTSATSQEYGVLWYASPYLAAGVTSGNANSANGTGTSFSGQFGIADTQSIEIELGVVLNDGSQSVSALTQAKTMFSASSTNSLAAGTMRMTAYVMQNQGGGTGVPGSGDIFSGTLTSSANWAVLCVPLTLVNQQAAAILIDWRVGAAAAQTSWASEASISANGMLVVLGVCGSGVSVTTGPSAMADASGNSYTLRNTTVLPSGAGTAFVFTAPVTAALAAGTTGTYNWGNASAAPNYITQTYWIPNALGVDANGVSAVTGISSAVSGSYSPASPNDMIIAGVFNGGTAVLSSVPSAPWNYELGLTEPYIAEEVLASQVTDLTATALAGSYSASQNWCLLMAGITMQLAGTGGGAAGGPGNAGYPGVWEYGAPGFAGGGGAEGGQGAAIINSGGGGAALPGGGGGGAYSSNNLPVQEGGQGGQGMIRLTWTPPLQPFNTLIVHSLGSTSDPNVCPLVTIPITDVPNNTEYLIPSVNGLLNASFSSTYTVLLCNYSWNSLTVGSPRQVTVTVNQYEYPGGPRYSVQVTRSVTPATDIVNGIVNMGEVTLPVKDYIAYNDQSYFTISINDTDTGDRFMDVLFLDTTGQTVLINIDPGQPGYGQYVNYFIDEATPDRDLGFVGASMQDREHQVSVLDYAEINGGALYIAAGDNLFMTYSPSGAPDLAVVYAPRWFLDRAV